MENTLENKAKFFGCHYGVDYVQSNGHESKISEHAFMFEMAKEGSYLELKPLSSITDEDATEVAKIFNQHLIKAHYSEVELNAYLIKEGKQFASRCEHYVIIYQYLQSKGYALPFMDLSVETLIEYGWIKLKEG